MGVQRTGVTNCRCKIHNFTGDGEYLGFVEVPAFTKLQTPFPSLYPESVGMDGSFNPLEMFPGEEGTLLFTESSNVHYYDWEEIQGFDETVVLNWNPFKAVAHAVSNVVHEAGKVASKVGTAVGHAVSNVAKETAKVASKVGTTVAKGAVNVVKEAGKVGQKIIDGVKTAAFAIPRAATLALIELNFRGWATKLHAGSIEPENMSSEKIDPHKAAQMKQPTQDFLDIWRKHLGGQDSKVIAAAAHGSKRKMLGFDSVGFEPTTTAATVASAMPILIWLEKLFKGAPDDPTTDNSAGSGGLPANGSDMVTPDVMDKSQQLIDAAVNTDGNTAVHVFDIAGQKKDKTFNVILYVAGGLGILAIIALVIVVIKSKKGK